MENNQNLKKRLYQSLINKSPKQNSILNSGQGKLCSILKPKVTQDTVNTLAKKGFPIFQKGKMKLQATRQAVKSPEVPKKNIPTQINKDKLSKEGNAILQSEKIKSKTNLKPHDIFAFYDAFPEMIEDFFYLNRVGSPYDYQIVTYSMRNKSEYMTISSKGVTMFHQKQAQFMTKQQWLADEKIYFSLQRIEFFRQYKISKNFTIWKNKMRRHYMKQMSNLLDQSLFLSFEYPRRCLLQVRQITNKLKDSFYFMPSDSITSMDPEDFLSNAMRHLNEKFIPKISNAQDMIVSSLQIAIDQEINKFKIQNNIKIQEVGDNDKKDHKEGYVYSQQAILRKQYKKVYKLIKLADTILIESKIELIQRCLCQLLEKLEQAHNENTKDQWITCTAYTQSENQTIYGQDNERIKWNPSVQGLKKVFKGIIFESIIKMNQNHTKISSRDNFQKYKVNEQVDTRKDEKRNTLKFMIEDSAFYIPLMKKIESYVELEFTRTRNEEGELLRFINIFSKHKTLPSIKEIFATNTAPEICQLMREWRQDDQTMQQLPDNKSMGILVFNYSELRKKMIFAPSQTMATFLNMLPQETSCRCRELLHQSKTMLNVINVYPSDITSFVSFNKAVRLASERLDGFMHQGKEVIQLVSLMDEHKLANIDFYKGRSKQVMQSIISLKSKVDQSNAKYDQSLSKFKRQLEANVNRVKTEVKILVEKFELIPFDTISSQIAPTLSKLDGILPTIIDFQKDSVQIQEIQTELSLPQTNFSSIHELYEKSRQIHELWKCKKEWNEMLIKIFKQHYTLIDCNQIKSKWEEFSSRGSRLQKYLTDNEVQKKLNIEITEFQNLLETILALTSSNLQEKSWRQISEYLAYELNVQNQDDLPFENKFDPQYTIQWLITNNISLYKEKIVFIVQKSQKQKQLQTILAEFKQNLSNIVIQTIVIKRQVALIKENQNLKENVKQKISMLYSLIGNQYSDALKLQAQVLIKHYEYIEEILQSMSIFRIQWQKYQPFFESNSSSLKLLTKQSKDFTSWELQWKKITKNITNDPTYFYRKVCDETTGTNCSRSIIKSMTKANLVLDMVKKGIQQFFQRKRIQFPRYCLFTDEQLLRILSKLDSRQLVNFEVIDILYDNVCQLEYEQEGGVLVSVKAKNGQVLPLIRQNTFKIQSEIEEILKSMEQLIKKTMTHNIRSTFSKYIEQEVSREALFSQSNLQVALCVDYIAWVRLAEETYLISQPVGTFEDWLNIQNSQIRELAVCISSTNSKQVRKKLLQSMVQSIYFRDKTEYFKENSIASVNEYQWQRIPRITMSQSQICLKQLHNRITYNSELLLSQRISVINCQSQRSWLSLVNAISNKSVIGLSGECSTTLKDLAFYVGQSIQEVSIHSSCNIKTLEKMLAGLMMIGNWIHFKPIQNAELLSYIAFHINNAKKQSLQSVNSSMQQILKNTIFNALSSSSIFLFENGDRLISQNFIKSENYRNISVVQPSQDKIIQILCQAQLLPSQLGEHFRFVLLFCQETFRIYKKLDNQFIKNVIKQLSELMTQLDENFQEDTEVLQYLTWSTVEKRVLIQLNKTDTQLFNSYRNSCFPRYAAMKSKVQQKLITNSQISVFRSYVKNTNANKLHSPEFLDQAQKVFQMLLDSDKLGVIIAGQSLTGKSYILKFAQNVYKSFLQSKKQQGILFETINIYQGAFEREDIISNTLDEKKQRKDKSDKNQKQKTQRCTKQNGILQNFAQRQAQKKWIIFDGQITDEISDLINCDSKNILLPNHGVIKIKDQDSYMLEKYKIICETTNIQNVKPNIIKNFGIISMHGKCLKTDIMVNGFFDKAETKKSLKFLNQNSINTLKSQLISILSRCQKKGNIRSKSMQFNYILADNEITEKTLKLIQCIFRMNSESIRQKEKNMQKTIQKFVSWAIMIVLLLHVQPDNQSKVQKRFMEFCKCETVFSNASAMKFIVYPGSGIQVHSINGLRTQSSLFQIPEKGIMTIISQNAVYDLFSSGSKNKFYQQISLEDISSIRVNYEESNNFSYYAQLFAYCNIPIVIHGRQGTGKKSILELYAKNNKSRSCVHSIRYRSSKNLMSMYEKPFRKFSSLEGTKLKSHIPNKSIIIFIQDLSMVKQQSKSLQFLRMLVSEQGYINKSGQKCNLTNTSNSIAILSHRMEAIDNMVLRLNSKLMFYQTRENSSEKTTSIFLPFLKAWSRSNGLEGECSRIFSSQNGDSLLDATISIFEYMLGLFNSKRSQGNFNFENIVLKPRIGDISKVLAFIIKTNDAASYPIHYYSETWASQIFRVFGDRISSSTSQPEDITNLLQIMKKEFFLKFKQNFQETNKDSLIFSNILTQQNRKYQRVQDIQSLQQFVINLIDSQAVTVPVKLFFNQLLLEIIKIYRIIELDNGHIVVLHPNKKVRQYLIELASQVAQSNFIPLKGNQINVQKDILPIIDLGQNVCLFQDLESISDNQIYQITCLLNKNFIDFIQLKQNDIKQRLSSKLTKHFKMLIAESSAAKQNFAQMHKHLSPETLKQRQTTFINQKIQEQLEATMREVFMKSSHFIFGASPQSERSKMLLLKEVDLFGCFHFNWFDVPEPALKLVSKQLLSTEQFVDQSEKLIVSVNQVLETQEQKERKKRLVEESLEKCMNIFHNLPVKIQNFNQLFTICQNVNSQKFRMQKENNIKIVQLKKCLNNYEQAKRIISQNQLQLSQLKESIEAIKIQQLTLSDQLEKKTNEINDIQLSSEFQSQKEKVENIAEKGNELKEIQEKIKELKTQKDQKDVESRNAHKSIQIANDFLKVLGDDQIIKKQIRQYEEHNVNLVDKLILWWSIISVAGKSNYQQIMQYLNDWQRLIGIGKIQGEENVNNQLSLNTNFTQAKQVFQYFAQILYPLSYEIEGWQLLSDKLKLKGILLMYCILHQEETTSSNRIFTLYDPSNICKHMFSFISKQSQLSQFSLGTVIEHFDQEFWNRVEQAKHGLIFLEKTITPREKKDLEKIIQSRRGYEIGRFISLVDSKDKADFVFENSKTDICDFLTIANLESKNPGKVNFLKNQLKQFHKICLKNQATLKKLKQKSSTIQFSSQKDTEQLSKIKKDKITTQAEVSRQRSLIKPEQWKENDQFLVVPQISDRISELCPNITLNEAIQLLYVINKKIRVALSEEGDGGLSSLQSSQQKVHQAENNAHHVVTQQKKVTLVDNRQAKPQQQIQSLKMMASDNLLLQGGGQQKSAQIGTKEARIAAQIIRNTIDQNFLSSDKVIPYKAGRFPFNLDLISLELNGKIPIVILPNNLDTASLLSSQHSIKPLNLLHGNFNNLMIENCQEKRINRCLVFYNDESHLSPLMDLVKKYKHDWLATGQSKTYCLYLFTNSSVHRLQREAEQNEACNFQIYHCKFQHTNTRARDTSCANLNNNSIVIVDQDSSKNANYQAKKSDSNPLKFIMNSTHNSNTAKQSMSKDEQIQLEPEQINKGVIEKYIQVNKLISGIKIGLSSEDLYSEAQKLKIGARGRTKDVVKFLSDVTHPIEHEDDIINFILQVGSQYSEANAIWIQQLQKLLSSANDTIQLKLKNKESYYRVVRNVALAQIEEIEQQLPPVFSAAEFIENTFKDSLSVQIEQFAKTYNKKVKQISEYCKRLKEQQKLSLGKTDLMQQHTIPTFELMKVLNKQYKILKKILSYLGIIIGATASVAKIASSRRIGTCSADELNYSQICINHEGLPFSHRTLNQLKLRVLKKAKIPIKNIKFNWHIVQNLDSEKVQNLVPEITLIISGTLIYSDRVIGCESLSGSHKLITSKQQHDNIIILCVPYDAAASALLLAEQANTDLSPRLSPRLMKKQTKALKEELSKQKAQTVKIPIVSIQNGVETVYGQTQFNVSQLNMSFYAFLTPKILVNQL